MIVAQMKKCIYILALICELAFCNVLYACSTCLWEITDFFFPSLMHWFAIGFIWMIIQVTTDHTFKVKHTFNLTFLRFLGLSFLTFIISGALLGPFPFIWFLLYPLMIFFEVASNREQKYSKKYRRTILITGMVCLVLLSVTFVFKKIEFYGLTQEQLIDKYHGTAARMYLEKN